ncbi:MAG: Fic family protein [Thermodesulfobacteriota bacterium]
MTTRAGNYVQQPGGYKAFIPKGLPPDPPLLYDDEIWKLLSDADRSLGRLDGSTDMLPDPDLFVFMYVRKEAVLSSQIEGTQASLMDVLEYEAHALEPGRPKDVGEVINYIEAMNYGLERLRELPLSLRLICEIHEKLLAGVRGSERSPGEFRHFQNWIGIPGIDGLTTAEFVPPPPHEMMEALNDLENFFYDQRPLPMLVKAGLIHAHFETIHPFGDGNGRLGRLLITFLICQQGVLKRPLLYLSYFFKKYKSEYNKRLQAIRDKGDWENWLKFFLRGVYEVAQEATNKARQIVNLREKHRALISQELGRGAVNGLALLEVLYSNPIISVETVSEITGLSFPNANRLVRDLCKIGVLDEITGRKRNRRFSYSTYLDLFKDSDQNGPAA